MRSENLIMLLVKEKNYTKEEAKRILADIESVIVEHALEGNVVSWPNLYKFRLKKYNELIDGKPDRIGPIRYILSVKRLRKWDHYVRRMTQYLLTTEEKAHNANVLNTKKAHTVRRRQQEEAR